MLEIIKEKCTAAWRAVANVSTCLGVAMIGIIWLGTAFHLTAKRHLAEEAAIKNSGNLARAFEEHLVRSIKEVDRVLLFLRDTYQKHGDSAAALNPAGRKDNEHLLGDIASQVGIIGADGFLRLAADGPILSPVDLRDREHFQVHLHAASDWLFIGRPVISRRAGEWVIPLTRRIDNQDGSFGGVIVATIETSYFTRYYNTINLGSRGAIALIGLTDGIFRASENTARNVRGEIVTDFLAYQSHLTAADGWYFTDAAWNDGIRRLVSYRAVNEFPLAVMVGLSEHEVYASTGPEQKAYDFVALLGTALVLLAIGFNIRRQHFLARTRSALQSQNLRFDAALNNMSHGLCMFDTEKRLVVCNDRYAEMYRLPPELVKEGTPLRDIATYRIMHGVMRSNAGDQILQQRIESLVALPVDTRSQRIEELGDGSLISITRDPMQGGGWVATHEDITEQRQSELKIEYMAHHDSLTGLANRVLLNARLEEALGRFQGGEMVAVHHLDLD